MVEVMLVLAADIGSNEVAHMATPMVNKHKSIKLFLIFVFLPPFYPLLT
jgi:hypothetical protein